MNECKHSKEVNGKLVPYHSYFCPDCDERLIPQEMNPCAHPKRRDGTCVKVGCYGKL